MPGTTSLGTTASQRFRGLANASGENGICWNALYAGTPLSASRSSSPRLALPETGSGRAASAARYALSEDRPLRGAAIV